MGHTANLSSLCRPDQIKPLRDRVLIRIDDRDDMIGSIIVPGIAAGLPNTGRVIAVGRGVTACKPGDSVHFEKFAHSDEEFLTLVDPDTGRPARYLRVKYEQVLAVMS